MSLTKVQLKKEIKKFLQDADRGISQRLFAELCGIDLYHMRDIFMYEKFPLTETMQIRVNKGYDAWKKGMVKVMQRRDRTVYVDYRQEAKPVFIPSVALSIKNGQIGLRVGMVNQHDYSQPDLLGK
jgi:hypothetical protein